MRRDLTQERLKELLKYDPETGVFVWRISRSRMKAGGVAGHVGVLGYRRILIDGKLYLSHRLAWFYVYGYFTENEIDHINRVRDDNRIGNLREVSRSCNAINSGIRMNNTSGVTGVCYAKECGKYRSSITIAQKKIHIGYYTSFDDAVKARWDAEVKYNWPTCNTTSSAYLYLKEKDLLKGKCS